MFCGLNAKKSLPNIEKLVAKIWSVKFSFLLSIYDNIMYAFYLSSTSDSLSFIISYTDKHYLAVYRNGLAVVMTS